MRLSEAILLGATMAPVGECANVNLPSDPKGPTRCALELALIAVGNGHLHWTMANHVWPWLGIYSLTEKEGGPSPMYNVVSKFDADYLGQGMSFDAFIDWVRSVEPPELEEVTNGDRAETSAATEPVCVKP